MFPSPCENDLKPAVVENAEVGTSLDSPVGPSERGRFSIGLDAVSGHRVAAALTMKVTVGRVTVRKCGWPQELGRVRSGRAQSPQRRSPADLCAPSGLHRMDCAGYQDCDNWLPQKYLSGLSLNVWTYAEVTELSYQPFAPSGRLTTLISCDSWPKQLI